MKKYLCFMLVMVLSVGVMADVVITEGESYPGVLELDIAADPAIAGLALEVTVDSGTLSSVALDGFNVFIDQAYSTPGFTTLEEVNTNPVANADAPGAITDLTGTFAVCGGSLTEDHVGVTVATLTLTSDEGFVVTVTGDETRGGAVAMDGTEVAVVGGTFSYVGPPPSCPEDLNGSGYVEAGDISMIIAKWGLQVPDGEGWIEDINGSGYIEAGDISCIISKWGMTAEECASTPGCGSLE